MAERDEPVSVRRKVDYMMSPNEIYNTYDYQGKLKKPEKLYHYTSLDVLQTILEKKQLRFTNRAYLNDKSEGHYVLSLCEEKIDDLWPMEEGKETFKKALESAQKELKEAAEKPVYEKNTRNFQIYQVSFSYERDSLIMWNYYAAGGGCSIQFSKEYMENLKNELNGSGLTALFGYVIYDVEKQVEILKGIFEAFLQVYSDNTSSSLKYALWESCLIRSILKIGALFKHPGFRDERECRMVFDVYQEGKTKEFPALIPPKGQEPYKSKIRISNGVLVPYVDFDFDIKYLQSITVSPTSNFEKVKQGLKIVLCEQGITDLPINHSEIPLRF